MNYKITYSNTKHARIRLLPDNSFELIIPKKLSGDQKLVQLLLHKGEKLLQKNLSKTKTKLEILTDEYVLIFGEKVLFTDIPGKFELFVLEKFEKESIFFLNKYASKIGFPYQKLIIKTFKTKWGSCSSNQNISLNFKLVHLPIRFLEYVVIHEVCHLKEKNHGKNFWKLVEELCPNYKEIRKELNQYIF
ncbi:MAG: M48 family metallopeptidase [Candidatus Altimarinota bacterium]